MSRRVRDEVLVAIMVFVGSFCCKSATICCLILRSSITASTTKSTLFRPSSLIVDVRQLRSFSISYFCTLRDLTSLLKISPTCLYPMEIAFHVMSFMRVRILELINSHAIPPPMTPAPSRRT